MNSVQCGTCEPTDELWIGTLQTEYETYSEVADFWRRRCDELRSLAETSQAESSRESTCQQRPMPTSDCSDELPSTTEMVQVDGCYWSRQEVQYNALGRLVVVPLEREPDPCLVKEVGMVEQRREKITFGVDSGAELTVVTEDAASEYPATSDGTTTKMRDCQGNTIKDLGKKILGLKSAKDAPRTQYTNVTVGPLRKNLMAVCSLVDAGHRVVFDPEGSYIEHIDTGYTTKMIRRGGQFDVDFWLEPYATLRVPPRSARTRG